MSTPRGLRVVDTIGVFYREEDGALMVADEFDGTRSVDAILETFEGDQVQIVAHHRPLEPHDLGRWGGGCCLFEPAGHCPFGHHETPGNLFTMQASGVLCRRERWSLDCGMSSVELRLDLLIGHRSQLLLVRPQATEEIRERVASLQQENLDNLSIEQLTAKLRSTRDLLETVNRLKDEIDV